MINRKFRLLSLSLVAVVIMASYPVNASAATTCNMSITKDELSRTVYITTTVHSNTGGDYDGIGVNWGDSEYGTQVGSMDGSTNTQTFNLQHTYYSAGTYDVNFFTESKACNVWGQVSFDAANSQPGSICQTTTNGVYGSWYLTAPDGVTNFSITNTTNNCCMDVPGTWTLWGIQNVNGYGTPTTNPASPTQLLPSGGSISWIIDYPSGSSVPAVPTISGTTSGLINTNYDYTFSATDPGGKQIRYGVDWSSPFDGVADEWLPVGGASPVVTTTWSKVSGPGTVTFANASAVSTTATFSSSGTYTLRLTGTDGTTTQTDDVVITVNPSAVVYWKFDELVGSYTFNDSSGNSTSAYCSGNCPLSGSVGKIGKALSFDGSSQNLEVTYDPDEPLYQLNASKPFSVSVWIKPNVSLDGWRGIIGGDYMTDGLLSGGDNSNSIGFYIQGTRLSTPSNSIPLNIWTHVTATYDGTTKSIYINGVLSAQANASGVSLSNSGLPLLIGANVYGSYFGGYMDDLRVFSKSLSASEVQNLATGLDGPSGSASGTTVSAGLDQTINLPSTASLSGTTSFVSSSNNYVNSGVSKTTSHSWSSAGVKQFKALTQNSDGTYSSWSSPYSVSIALTSTPQDAICGTKAGGPSSSTRYYSGGETGWYVGDIECYVGTASTQTFPANSVTWSCTGVNGGNSASCTAVNTHGVSTKTLTVTTAKGGKITSQPAGINCGSTCTGNFAINSSVKLVPVPDSIYWKFTGWTGACTGTGACNVNMNADKAVGATFGPRIIKQSEL